MKYCLKLYGTANREVEAREESVGFNDTHGLNGNNEENGERMGLDADGSEWIAMEGIAGNEAMKRLEAKKVKGGKEWIEISSDGRVQSWG